MSKREKREVIDPVFIAERAVGGNAPAFIIAEAGVNHNGDMQEAHALIDAAAGAGADAIKFQSFITEELITAEAQKANYQVKTTGSSGGQYEMLKKLELNPSEQKKLKTHCEKAEIIYLCTPYEAKSADALENIGIAAYKIASTDTTNIPFLRHIAKKGCPVILSTGMSTLGEVEKAVDVLRAEGLEGKIILLHCTSEYPAPIDEANLNAIDAMQKAFACPVGFSDHTPGILVAPWAVALGACIIEKHFTLDRTLPGPDHATSVEPAALAELIEKVRQFEAALGDGVKRPMPSELVNKPFMQKSVVAVRTIRAGEIICEDSVTCKRPGLGLSPSWFDRIVGKRAAVDIPKDSLLNLSSVDWDD